MTEEISAYMGIVHRGGRDGPQRRMRGEDGPEVAARMVRSWLDGTGSEGLHAAPGRPWRNGYAESFHSEVPDVFLDREEFESERQVKALGALWKEEYGMGRPHSSPGYETPAEFPANCVGDVPVDEVLPEHSLL